MIIHPQINKMSFLEAGVYLCNDSSPRRVVFMTKQVCLVVEINQNDTATVLVNGNLLLVPIDSIKQ